ncbi:MULTISPECIES: class 1 fructose-bisphosphatase [Pseudoalteromonas]|jgi:fructose-1,6-bisphosphatase I|uniref:Fructose-1,6-bisphosphatase class 1 1 n=5 Tax=Pseudoalteromonas TaxID=53246 RepID=F16A1_PSET1|nr:MULTISPECIES: class 1 fructose-bisphosphatase [Pseudoalteromonas]Q3IFQ5.1 RecName: Full=Fructose-1,6-bisphosphatase class 1 1; Short=FBPase class 1 1; AltName: Full=D-fructose-1,6-bisphosphate 1-phosphohydrolase class 1 1 [Pseudoalteromonas translucida TAC125]ALS31881.1 fructose-1,6-bisphosphatase I [Pseudoalteromonas translucida KMM 520]MBB1372505.1 class 1 fructose-bisphosphatase [Pseudoalteromonas sp. SR45-4]MBB1406126.1 class 1 fructose-bisphosphatase [Pseudoalteromonas sp. SG44-5]MBH00|tara:strand:+ start:12312 stop:13280 length:969 start_codon:yes stop_codon:yes gene_type:complete
MRRLPPVLLEDGCPRELISLIRTILAACKEISFRVGQGELSGVLGSTLDENIQGETQKKLDVLTNQLLKDILLESGYVKAIASEEEDYTVAGNPDAEYIVAFDPLDGSSNTDINSLVGTIFSVMKAPEGADPADQSIFMQPGINQVAAGYVLYGPSTILALTTGKGTRFFTLDKTHGTFLLTQDFAKIPADTNEYAINASNQRHWQPAMQNYINDLVAGDTGPRARNFNMRWIAAMVGDVHRVLSRGGLFTYPTDTKNPSQPNKLRLLYEANPMAMLVEQAGGIASTGTERIMDIQPNAIHQRVAVILGSKNEVETCLGYHK